MVRRGALQVKGFGRAVGGVLAAVVAFCAPLRAPAFEWVPEFLSLTETEQIDLEGPGRFASEYSADLLTYVKPASWEYLWLTHAEALDISLGSLSGAHFLINTRLKIHAPLTEHLEFRFSYVDERDRERDITHDVIELVFWPWRKLGISLYGEPELYKRNNDTGLALVLRPTERHEIRLFNTFVDVTRLKRTDRPDNYIEPYLPYSRGVVGRLWSASESRTGDFLEYAFRYDTLTRWQFPVERYDYEYWRAMASVFGSLKTAEKLSFNTRAQLDRKWEGRTPFPEGGLYDKQLWRTDRLDWLLRAEIGGVGPGGRWHLTPGLEFVNRVWRINDENVIYRDILPHLILTLPGLGSGALEDRWTIGWISTWHRAFGPERYRDPHDADRRWENRLNLSYDFNFGEKGALSLSVSGDLDEAFTRRSWDGGSAEFQLFF